MAETDRVRLHISPFSSALYETVINSSLQPLATNVSFHSVQTFPERAFGYIELPKPDADKLRKKFHGFILRGAKMNIQEAKPEKKRRGIDDAEAVEEAPRKKAKKEKSSKKKDGEYKGFELPDKRHVKRGWTEEPGKYTKEKKDTDGHKDKKDKTEKREKSKYTTSKEVLFKQKLPAPVLAAQKAEGKDKKDKKTGKSKTHVIVHEFEKTKHYPSFLKAETSSGSAIASEFVAGKGWVDAEGNVIEAINVKPKREDRIAQMPDNPVEIRIKKPAPQEPAAHKSIAAGAKALKDAERKKDVYNSDSSEESEESESEESESEPETSEDEENDEVDHAQSEPAVVVPASKDDSEDAKSDSESESEAEVGDKEASSEEETEPVAASEPTEAMEIDEPSTSAPATPPREVHPLEALFKRPKPATAADETPRPAPIDTSFSFFPGAEEEEEEEEAEDYYPLTPFNPHDIRGRGIRSAAPTPDTAAIGRKFSFSFGHHGQDIDEDEEEYDDTNQVPLGTREGKDGEEEETEFSKWFWENRGDSNRGWKKRRRDVMKQKRQRENRRLSRKVI